MFCCQLGSTAHKFVTFIGGKGREVVEDKRVVPVTNY
jgi:hypothetical protein